MKRKFMWCLFCFLLLAFVSSSGADLIIGTGISTGGGDCPGGTYKFYWNGEHPSGTNYACKDSGASTITGTLNSDAEIDTYTNLGITGCGTCGTYGLHLPGHSDNLEFAVTSLDIFDDTAGTLVCEVYFKASTSINEIFDAYGDSNNEILFQMADGTDLLYSRYKGNSTQLTDTTTDGTSDETWMTVKLAWSQSDTPCSGSGTGCTSIKIDTGSWEEDSDPDNCTDWSTAPVSIHLGDELSGLIFDGLYLDNCRISDTYQDGSL